MSKDSNIEYHSSERRNAIRVTPEGCCLTFVTDQIQLKCLDISVDGVALESDLDLSFNNNDQVAFVLNADNEVIGKVLIRLVYKTAGRSGWQFTMLDETVREFVEGLVLETQKKALRKAASIRITEAEKNLLDLKDKE